jgi:hypothetical protein
MSTAKICLGLGSWGRLADYPIIDEGLGLGEFTHLPGPSPNQMAYSINFISKKKSVQIASFFASYR